MPPTMWSGPPPLPAFSVERLAHRNNNKIGSSSAPKSPPPLSYPAPSSISAPYHHSQSLADLLEPAVDGPPSPESIRAFSKRVKEHAGTSTSSLASAGSWDCSLDAPPSLLSRNSSGRSANTRSMAQVADRSDSVTIFTKSLFHKNKKSRRESNAYSNSSGSSSVYSADAHYDITPPPPPPFANNMPGTTGHAIPSLFSRRKTLRDSVMGDAEPKRKYQISAPYNFQHLAHTEKQGLPDLQRCSRAVLQSEMRASKVTSSTSLVGINTRSIHSTNSSLERFEKLGGEVEPYSTTPEQLSPISPRTRVPPHRTVSHEIAGSPPPRPPRFDLESISPVVPPRVSSRVSLAERPKTSGCVSAASDRSSTPEEEDDLLLMRRHNRESSIIPLDFRFSRVVTPIPDDVNWPLTSPLSETFDALPEVPEEEEAISPAAAARASMISTRSSLRPSASLPMLRQSIVVPDNASDVLGDFCGLARMDSVASRAEDDLAVDNRCSFSWEADIDYCYEHEVEADCDYAWERPSLDLCRPDDDDEDHHLSLVTDYLRPHHHLDMPALSPASQVSSSSTAMEAITPTSAHHGAANFSLPAPRLHSRVASYASTFKESHGFNLSPTLLIPGGEGSYSEEPEWYRGQDEVLCTRRITNDDDEPVLPMSRSRASASTVDSFDMRSDRHASTASTALTRFTTRSTSSVNISGLAADSQKALPPPPTEAAPPPPITARPRGQSDGSSSGKLIKQRKETAPPRPTRPRARTMSHALAPSMQTYAAYNLAVSRI